jgi:5'(3')-deoxyribonucleotidase
MYTKNSGAMLPRNYGFSNNKIVDPEMYVPKIYLEPKNISIKAAIDYGVAMHSKTLGTEYTTILKTMLEELFKKVYYDVIITQKNYNNAEVKQEVRTTDGSIIRYYYNNAPKVLRLSGVLLNTVDNDWLTKFQFYYDYFMRGTALKNMQSHIVFDFGDIVYRGFFSSFNFVEQSTQPSAHVFDAIFDIETEKYINLTDGFISSNSNSKYLQAFYPDTAEDAERPSAVDPFAAKTESLSRENTLTRNTNKANLDKAKQNHKKVKSFFTLV